jgi:hypothetical protein
VTGSMHSCLAVGCRVTRHRMLRPLQAAACTYRIAFGPRAGQKMLTLRRAMPRDATARQPLCADIDGFSPHAAVRVEAHDRNRLEQPCRYITRPALADERVQLNAAGQVELKLKTSSRDGTTHLVMSPLECMQRLAALVPRLRLRTPMTAPRLSISAVSFPVWVDSSPSSIEVCEPAASLEQTGEQRQRNAAVLPLPVLACAIRSVHAGASLWSIRAFARCVTQPVRPDQPSRALAHSSPR